MTWPEQACGPNYVPSLGQHCECSCPECQDIKRPSLLWGIASTCNSPSCTIQGLSASPLLHLESLGPRHWNYWNDLTYVSVLFVWVAEHNWRGARLNSMYLHSRSHSHSCHLLITCNNTFPTLCVSMQQCPESRPSAPFAWCNMCQCVSTA